jgi:hypothetical protein
LAQFGATYFNLVQLRLKLALVFGLGARCAFLVFFFGEATQSRKAAGAQRGYNPRIGATRHFGRVQHGNPAFTLFPRFPDLSKSIDYLTRPMSQF